MARIDGVDRLRAKIRELERKAKDISNAGVVVGYSQNYALFVHENLDANHPVGKAKFLEDPLRRLRPELSRIVGEVYKRTKSMEKALLTAGLRLQRESQQEVPVDTSALKASAYTALERNAETAAMDAFHASEQLRKSVLSKREAKKQRELDKRNRRGR